MSRQLVTEHVVGAGGFEPPNTGSKVPRLTAWPRPIAGWNRGGHSAKGHAVQESPRRRLDPTCPQKIKSTGSTRRLAIGRARRSCSARVSVRVTRRPWRRHGDNGLTARSAGSAAAEQAENGRAAARHRGGDAPGLRAAGCFRAAISGWRRTTGGSRSLIICAARVGHGTGSCCSSRVLAARPARPVLVVPAVGLGGRHAERRPDDDDAVRRQIDERIDLLAAAEPERGAARQEERHVGADRRRPLRAAA